MKKSLFYAGLALLALPLAVSGAVNFPCGTYIIAGSVLNSQHEIFAAQEGITIQAMSEDGVILAESGITDPFQAGSDACNCRLEIPLSTTASKTTAAVGDTVNLVMKVGTELKMSANPVKIASANDVTNLVVQVVDVTMFVNKTNSAEYVYISNEYLDSIAPWLSYIGKDVYDAYADWDGDGSLNYQEYVNGTNPFDPLDYLKVTNAKMMASGNFMISFEYVGGHVYGLMATESMTKPKWIGERQFKTAESSTLLQKQAAYPGNGEESGVATIYVVPASTTEFFKVTGK